MSDTGHDELVEAETPVNPYSLLEAVNSSSDTAHTGWLIFLGFMAYLVVAVAGVTHKDLLLASDLALPILQVKINLTQFFLFAPIILVLFHIGITTQLVMLARKAIELDKAVLLLETTERRSHPLRLELHNFFFVQAIAGPDRSRVMSTFLHGMTWLTLVILPVLVILYVQTSFLPFHDIFTTSVHRVALLADIVMQILIGVFLSRPEVSFFSAFGRMSRDHPFSLILTTLVLAAVTGFSLFVATVPDEPLDRLAQRLPGAMRASATDGPSNGIAMGFVMPFLGATADGTLFGLFERNLNVNDVDLVVDKDVTGDEASINLRGRNLRYARLERTDLHQADLTGADIDGASFAGADLRKVIMGCADLSRLRLTESRESAKCTSAKRADFRRARLSDARMQGMDLRSAKLDEAMLDGADLKDSELAGASFYNAQMERVDLTGGIWMQGVNFGAAQMQGADLTGAKLIGADLRYAQLQGASLGFADLQGAQFGGADLEGADLSRARLQGASLAGAVLRGTDLRGAMVWLTAPPSATMASLADLGELAVKPLEPSEVADLRNATQRIGDTAVRGQVRDTLARLLSNNDGKAWGVTPERQEWQALVATLAAATGEGYKQRLTEFLLRNACKPRWAGGALASGLARRTQSPGFDGDVGVVYDRLRAADCPGGRWLQDRKLGRDLAAAVDVARGN